MGSHAKEKRRLFAAPRRYHSNPEGRTAHRGPGDAARKTCAGVQIADTYGENECYLSQSVNHFLTPTNRAHGCYTYNAHGPQPAACLRSEPQLHSHIAAGQKVSRFECTCLSASMQLLRHQLSLMPAFTARHEVGTRSAAARARLRFCFRFCSLMTACLGLG